MSVVALKYEHRLSSGKIIGFCHGKGIFGHIVESVELMLEVLRWIPTEAPSKPWRGIAVW